MSLAAQWAVVWITISATISFYCYRLGWYKGSTAAMREEAGKEGQ